MTVDASLYTEDFDLERFRAGEEVYAVQTYFSNKSKRVFKYIRDDGYHLMCTENINLRIDLVTTKYKHLWRMKPPAKGKDVDIGEKPSEVNKINCENDRLLQVLRSMR